MAAGEIIRDFKPIDAAISEVGPEIGPVVTDFQPIESPIAEKVVPRIEDIGLVPSHKTLQEPPPFDLDKNISEWTKTRDKEEDPPEDDITQVLWPLVRPFLAQGYSAAAALNRGLGVFSEHLAIIDEWAAKRTGGVLKSVIPWKEIANNYDAYTQYWSERASEVGINFIDELIGESAGGAVPGIAEFVLNVPYAATLGAAEAFQRGENEIAGALVEGAKRGLLGAIFKSMDPLKQYLRAPIMGTVFGIQAAAEGAEAKEIAKSFGTGMIYSLTSPGGAMGLNEVRDGLRKEIPRVEKKIWKAPVIRSMPAETGITLDQLEKNDALADSVLKRPIINEATVIERAKEIKGIKEIPAPTGIDAIRQSVVGMSEPVVSLEKLEKIPPVEEELSGTIRELREFVKIGEPGKKMGTETGQTISWGSSYPPFMRNEGWTKVEVLAAIDKGLEGQKMGVRQQRIFDAVTKEARGMISDRMEEVQRNKDRNSIIEKDPDFLKEGTINTLTSNIDDEIMGLKEEWREQGHSESEINGFVEQAYKTAQTQGILNEAEAIKNELTKPTKELEVPAGPKPLEALRQAEGILTKPAKFAAIEPVTEKPGKGEISTIETPKPVGGKEYWEMTPEETGLGEDYRLSALGKEKFFEASKIIQKNVHKLTDEFLSEYARRKLSWAQHELQRRTDEKAVERVIEKSIPYGEANNKPWEKSLAQFYREYQHPLEGIKEFKIKTSGAKKLMRGMYKEFSMSLPELVDSPELFLKHPELKGIKIAKDLANEATTRGEEMSFGKNVLNEEVVAEEITHYIRDKHLWGEFFFEGTPTEIYRSEKLSPEVKQIYLEVAGEQEARSAIKILNGTYSKSIAVYELHKELVRRALERGEKIRKEVLRDYEKSLPKPSAPPEEGGALVTFKELEAPAGPKPLEALRQAEREKTQRGAIEIGKEAAPKPAFSFEENIEKAYQKSIPVEPPVSWKIKKAVESMWHKVSREYEFLPKKAEYAQLRFKLKTLEKQKGVAAHNTAFEIAEEIANLDKESYDLFSRKIVLSDLRTEAQRGHELPWGLTPEKLEVETNKLNQAIEQSNIKGIGEGKPPAIQEAMERRRKDAEALRKEYIEAMKDIDFDVEPMMINENYFRHQVLNYVEMEGLYGTGQKLKTPAGRGFLKRREGTTLDINRDFLIPEELVRAQMRHDIEIAKVIKWVDDNMSLHRSIKALAKAKGEKDWHKVIPEGYVAWQPREGNIFYMADSIPAQIARTLHADKLKEIGIKEEDLQPILAVGGRRTEFVLKKEVAEQLDKLVRKKDMSEVTSAVREVTKGWKVWQLLSPRRLTKYNLRNLSGDADATFVGNPRGFLRAPQAVREIWDVFVNKKEMTPEMKDWFERGGIDSTLQAQELEGLQDVWLFSRLYEKEGVSWKDIPGRIWKKYWKTARMGTDMRESVLRYANYLEYLDQMKESKGGVPKNFGASIPEEILALGDIRDRAYWLSNDLVGAYDRVSVMGQNMRDYWFPFWSWKEVNFKRYIQFAKNAAYNGEFAERIGKMALDRAEGQAPFIPTPKDLEELRQELKASKGDIAIAAGKKGMSTLVIRSPFIAAKVGKFVALAVALQSVTQVWNHMFFPTEEEDLPEEERAKPHIIFGRDSEGNVQSFNRLGALGDFLEWFGMEESPVYARKWMDGEMTLSEIIVDMAKSPINIFAQNLRPDIKTIGEIVEGRKIFPDVFEPTQIRDSWFHVAQHLGLENEYIAISGLPSKGYADSMNKFLLYSTDPGQAAYSEIQEAKRRYLQRIGKGAEGFWLTPKGNALYNLKLAIRYQDQTALEKYMLEYFELGGSAKGIGESLERMHPLAGLSKQDRGMFLGTLSEEQTKKLEKALDFYMTTLMGGG